MRAPRILLVIVMLTTALSCTTDSSSGGSSPGGQGDTSQDDRAISAIRDYTREWNRTMVWSDSVASLGLATGDSSYGCVLWYTYDWTGGLDGNLQGLVVNGVGGWVWWIFSGNYPGAVTEDHGNDPSDAPSPGPNQIQCTLSNEGVIVP